jgi:Septin family protein
MVPKIFTDAGYTAVGLGVLAVQQVQTRRRETRSRVSAQIQARRQNLESALGQVKARIEPLQAKLEPLQAKLEPLQARLEPVKARLETPVSAALGRLPHIPGPLGGLLVSGRDRIQAALRHEAGETPPARHSDQGEPEAASDEKSDG